MALLTTSSVQHYTTT